MQWDRNTAGRLKRLSASIEEGCEVSLHTNQMETLPEEQQSQQGVHREPNAYRSMRDHIHPPRVSAPSCIMIRATVGVSESTKFVNLNSFYCRSQATVV